MATVPEIAPEELLRAVEAGEGVHVLDVRAPHRLASGRIDLVPPHRFHNVKGSELLAMADPSAAGLARGDPLAVVCGMGADSRRVAEHLNAHGFSAKSLRGGMAAWMKALAAREAPCPAGLDAFVQFDRVGKGSLGYLLASGGEALVVDPPRAFEPYLEKARSLGARVVGVADTHAHADYISGGPALARLLGVPYRLHPADAVSPYDGARAKIAFSPLGDGERIRVGRAEATVAHTPGHTEGSVTLLLGGDAALTGDFLFVRSIGRPDLGGKAAEWSRALWRSVERARRGWPRDLRVYPAHYSCETERGPARIVGAPLSDLLARNEPLGLRDEEDFVAWVTNRAGAIPDLYRRIKEVNLGLLEADDDAADALEFGRNECALG
ncbi:MAG: MBL fold metallo-hydrolase [Planctomycetota bacterium]